MNEQNPEASAVELTSPPYKDRSSGLMVFGILTIILGALAGLLVIMMVVGQIAVQNTGAPATPVSSVVLAALVYLFVAVAFIWLGIGSIQARRWARALLLIISWSWLVTGVASTVLMGVFMPKFLAGLSAANTNQTNQALPPAAVAGVMIFMGLMLGIVFIIMPIIWTVFYQSRHVKATCEARDTTARWTDACPLPVLALSLWLAFWVLWLLGMPLTGHPLIPFFGTFLTGLAGALVSLVLAPICICAAWLLYKLDVRGWWLALIMMVLYWVSVILTYSRHDLNDMYQLMGYSQAQLDQLQKFNAFGQHMTWASSFFMAPFIIYILFIRKYMRSKA